MIANLGRSLGPLFLYIIMQIPVFFIGVCIMPEKDKVAGNSSVALKTYVSGQLFIWALFQIMAVPLILLRVRFDILYYAFLVVAIVLCVLGVKQYFNQKGSEKKRIQFRRPSRSLSTLAIIILCAAVVLIILQISLYFLGQHVDEDDARWLAEANDALAYGDMMTRNVSTGEFLGSFETIRDVTSPWPMFFAMLARILHINTAMTAHTIYAPMALLVSYCIYYLIASELFIKIEAQIVFVFLAALLNLFYAGTVYTQAVFSLVRIWQGKATVAGIIIPFLLYLTICINKRNETSDWLCLIITGCAACLTSGMGVSLSGILIIVFGGYNIIAYQRWKRIPLWLFSIAPSVAFSLLYFYLKG